MAVVLLWLICCYHFALKYQVMEVFGSFTAKRRPSFIRTFHQSLGVTPTPSLPSFSTCVKVSKNENKIFSVFKCCVSIFHVSILVFNFKAVVIRSGVIPNRWTRRLKSAANVTVLSNAGRTWITVASEVKEALHALPEAPAGTPALHLRQAADRHR